MKCVVLKVTKQPIEIRTALGKAFLTCMRRQPGDAVVSDLIMRSICLADIAQKPSELALLPA